MHSSTFSSKRISVRLVPLVLILTVAMLGAYWGLASGAGWQATSAESNLNAGLLRLQALDQSQGSSAITIGTSITAKLRPDLIFNQLEAEPLNMGIDGGSSLFAARKVLASKSLPKIILLEANLILKQSDSNMQTLDESTESVAFRMARYLPILRREYRPVTVLYSALKLLNDERRSTGGAAVAIDASKILVERPADSSDFLPAQVDTSNQWTEVLSEFRRRGVPVVLVMVPDGHNDRQPEYDFSRRLAAQNGLPLIDLKAQFADQGLVYSDGTHLLRRSADIVSRTLNAVLVHNGLAEF